MSTNLFVPHRAEKKRVKLKMAVQGPSGSGKTWGSLALARNIWPEAKICLIDTENESASLYADSFEFDTIPLAPPFETTRYVQCIDAVVKAAYDVLIIDSITPQWDGEGGILRRKEALERKSPGANGYALWAQFTPEHEAFKQIILQAPIHTICTMRSKQEYAMQQNDKGKNVVVKLGMSPIQRDQIDYEFTIVFDVSVTHAASVSKDRTGLFDEKVVNLADQKTADLIHEWLEKGIEVVSSPPEIIPFETASSGPDPEATRAIEEAQKEPLAILAGNQLTCTVITITEKKLAKDQRPFIHVMFKGNVRGVSEASCFDTKFFDLIRKSLKLESTFKVAEKNKDGKLYLNIEDVVSIDKTVYAFGEPIGDKAT